jgi:DNA-binding transcriptional LysR family regulator
MASNNPARMDPHRLRLLLELSRRGSMRAVGDALGYTTSTVSHQLAVLAREAGATLIEPEGRRVRLTPAGQRLAEHAMTILAALEAARADLDPSGEPAGTVRVAAFATAIRQTLVPILARLCAEHPAVRLRIHEHEPPEAFALLAADEVDLALVYDYTLAPVSFDPAFQVNALWTATWALGVPGAETNAAADDAPTIFGRYADAGWIVNSRNVADEHVIRTIASLAGFEPHIAHRVDSLALVQELILAEPGVGLLPDDTPPLDGVELIALRRPEVRLRAYTATRPGRDRWPPLRLVTELMATCGSRRSRPFRARGCAARRGSGGWPARRRRRQATRTRGRSPRRGSSRRRPRSPAPGWRRTAASSSGRCRP